MTGAMTEQTPEKVGTNGHGATTLLVNVGKSLLWTPNRLRWDAESSHELSWGLCFLYAAVSFIHSPDVLIFGIELFPCQATGVSGMI
jgi:hypothetical protein